MAEYLIQGETLDAIAEAINQKAGTQVAMTPAQMVAAIGAISGGVRKATGTFTILSETNDNSPTITHNLNTQKIAAIIYPVSVSASVGYLMFYAAYLNVPELVDSGNWSLDFTSYNSANFPNIVSLNPKSSDGSNIRDLSRQTSPWTSQNNWYAANNEKTFNSDATLTDNTVRLYPSITWAAGSYKWIVFALE